MSTGLRLGSWRKFLLGWGGGTFNHRGHRGFTEDTGETIITTGETIITAGTGRLGETVDEIEAVVVRRLTWRLVAFLFLLYIVAYLDRINVGVAALQMRQQLSVTDAGYGVGAGKVFVGDLL